MKIYRIQANSNDYQRLRAVEKAADESFNRFVGTPLGPTWKPVEMAVYRLEEELEEKQAGDFPSLASGVTGLSLRAAEGLFDLLTKSGEILPLLCDEGDYFAYNVTFLSDALDEERSKIARFASGRMMDIQEFQFHRDRLGGVAIFKLVQLPHTTVLVTEEFVQRVEALGLVGLNVKLVWDSDAPAPSGVPSVEAEPAEAPPPPARVKVQRPKGWVPPPPLFGGVPVDEEVVRLIETSGLDQTEQLLGLMRPSVRFWATRMEDDEIPVGCSKLGGAPDMGWGVTWPRWEGESLTFLAQINLADVAELGLSGPLPSEGMLSFFYADPKRNIWGYDPSENGFRVLFHPGPATDLVRATIPDDVPTRGRYRACLLEGTVEWQIPPWESEQTEALGLDEVELELYSNLEDRLWAYLEGHNHRFLGYPNQMQGSVAADCIEASTGMDWDDASLFDEALKWTLLFQVNTEPAAGMVWGDYGCLYFYMREDDLRCLAFDKVWMVLQCT